MSVKVGALSEVANEFRQVGAVETVSENVGELSQLLAQL